MEYTATKEADGAFSQQVLSQLTRIMGELTRLDHLLSAGLVDRRVLTEFRDAVERIHRIGWQVQAWLDGDSGNLATQLMEQHINLATRVTSRLASELQAQGSESQGLVPLKEAMQKLDRALDDVFCSADK